MEHQLTVLYRYQNWDIIEKLTGDYKQIKNKFKEHTPIEIKRHKKGQTLDMKNACIFSDNTIFKNF